MEDGDPTLPMYAAVDDNDMVAWIDRMAARADELQLPLTHPRFNSQIVWIKTNGVTTGRRWAGTGPYLKPREDGTLPDAEPDVIEALIRSECAASLLMEQKVIIETFFRLVRMGQTGLVTQCVQKGLVSPDVTDGRGYENMYSMQYDPEEKKREEREKKQKEKEKKAAKKKSRGWFSKKAEDEDTTPEPVDPASRAPPLTSANRGDPWNGTTPLLTAVDAGDAAMVRVLVNLGADINRMARPPELHRAKDAQPQFLYRRARGMDDELDRRVRRTPLMLAAAQGRIALAKLFYEELKADDSLTAPDGYHALRLAAEGRHREIVEMLPARRGGAWLRFATRHGHAMKRIAKAGRSIVWFTTTIGKIVVWYLPKYLLYVLPKELIVMPLGRLGRYLWQHRAEILPAIGHFLVKLPKTIWMGVRGLGEILVDVAKGLADMTVTFVKRIPKLLAVAGQWIVATLKTVAGAIAHVAGRALSAIHTALAAVANWFRTITLADVVRGFEAVASAIFIGLPQAVWKCVLLLGEYSLKSLQVMFGSLASIIYFIGLCLFHIAIFVPRQLWRILTAIGSYFGGAFHEVIVWFNPKSV
ncbi:hypothetical protein Sste5346_002039 [Sporothrix stenoceras]|uniref:Ankyrin repeat protein n=1 Tax=Sporothrix stenoceras TaxID=5173 RepID=A0ABR3ZJY9_9PEZI